MISKIIIQLPRWLIFVCFSILVDGHSILRDPLAWNQQRESKTAPCGAGRSIPTTVMNKVTPGSTVQGMWEVTAGDGNGPVTITLAKTDQEAQTFSGNLDTIPIQMNPVPARGTGKYQFSFTAPAAGTCTGGVDKQSCHLQFKSTSRWYSCTTLSLDVPAPTGAPTTAAPTRPQETAAPTDAPTDAPLTDAPTPTGCTIIPLSATYCKKLIGKSVHAQLGGESIEQALAALKIEGDFNRNNPLVFRRGDDTQCFPAFEDYWCGRAFPLCTNNGAVVTKLCKKRCEKAISLCDLDPLHDTAFSCSKLGEQAADIYGTCPTSVTERKISLKNRYVGTTPGFWTKDFTFTSMVVYAGDKLTFKYDQAVSDVKKWAASNEADYNSCTFTSATDGPSLSNGEATWTAPLEAGYPFKLYFGSSKSGACKADTEILSQKLMVTVVAIPKNSMNQPVKTIPISSDVPEVITGAPTPAFVPINNPNDSDPVDSSSISVVPLIFTTLCSLLISSISY